MSQILNRVLDVDSSNSEAVKETLAAFFQNLLNHKEIDSNRWLRALENVINRFPKYCGTHRQTIDQYLSHFLSSNNFYNVIEAGKCAHAVQQVRPSQEKAATAKTCWRDQMAALCDAAIKIINDLFPLNIGINRNIQITKNQGNPSSLLLKALSEIDSVLEDRDGAVNRTTLLCTRLRNVLIFIQAMLVEIYPVAKPIQPQLVLTTILQVLSGPFNGDSADVTAIKVEAFRTLDALVACLGSNLIPYSALVFRLIMQSFKWCNDNATEGSSKIRITAYNSIAKWLDTLHVHRPPVDGHSRLWHDELAINIIADVTPAKQVMELTVNAQPMKNLSKKARKRLANTMLKESNIASHMPGEKNKNKISENEDVVVAALACAESFLSACGLFLKTSTHKQFQELLVQESFRIQEHSSEKSIGLLRALEACRKSCSVKVPPPTQYCLQLYSSLLNSSEREVSKFCSQALLDIRLHLHCSPASLCYSREEEMQKKKQEKEGRKRTSERNRAALEQLLGIDWMKTADPTVVAIQEEPVAKRTRVDDDDDDVSEITENISISSDSVHSVEMSSDSDDESIIEGIGITREPRDHIIEDDDVIFEPDNTVSNNEPTQAVDKQTIVDETVVIVDTNNEAEGIKDIHDERTQAPTVNDTERVKAAKANKDDAEVERIMESPFDSQKDIHEAKTQLLQNSDTVDGKSPLSMEVAYDYPNTGNDKVTVLEKMDDENLPSTNDTDDIQITCGQVVKNSQDLDVEKSKDGEAVDVQKDAETPKVNGIDKSIDNTNGDAAKENDATASKITPNDKVITVEDMLADFVDEVNEETQA